jgi:hypothetical protein
LGHSKKLGNIDVWVHDVKLSMASLDIQQFISKVAIKSNANVIMAKPLDVNPFTPFTHFFNI